MIFLKNVLQNTRSMKTYVSLQFSKQENMHFIVTMSNSHKNS